MNTLTKLRKKMQEQGFDALLVTDENNQYYTTHFWLEDGAVLVTAENAYVITDNRYIEAARKEISLDFEVLVPEGKQIDEINLLLAINDCKNIVLEDATLSYADFARYCELLNAEVLTGASDLFSALRVIKENWELEAIAKAQKITDDAFTHILKVMQPTMTEWDVALELEYFMRKNGAQSTAFNTIAVSGIQSSRPHGVPRNVPLEKGFLTMDFGARLDSYCSDMTRTVVLGKADNDMKKLYHTVLNAQQSALDMLRSGVVCSDVDKVARDIIDASYPGAFGHSLGHGVGLYIHEKPNLSTRCQDKLAPGHVITVEPGIYLAGKYGCRIEDMVCILQNGEMHNFTKSPKELLELFL